MNDQEFMELKKLIVFVADYYSKELKPETVAMMANDLCDLDFHFVKNAYESYRKNDKYLKFPMPAVIREMVAPEPSEDDQAREIASRITQAISTFGWPNGTEARAFIGEIGWELVRRRGGWSSLCENHGVTIDPGMFEAQTRELAKVQLKSQINPHFASILEFKTKGILQSYNEKSNEEIEERKKLLETQIEQTKEAK